MSIAFDNSSTPSFSNPVTTQSYSFTTSGADRFLVVYTLGDAAATSGISSVTYSGVSLTKLDTNRVDTDRSFDVWYLINPAVGSNTLVVDRSVSGLIVSIPASYTGVDQITGIGNTNKGSQSALNTTFSGTVSIGTANSWGVIAIRDGSGATITGGAGLVIRSTAGGFGSHFGDSNATTSGTHTFNATFSSSVKDAYIAFELLEAGGAGPTANNSARRLHLMMM